MAGADPITLSVVGAAIGAATNKNDPVKGAVIGGAAGFAGGNILGASAAPAGGVVGGTGLTTGVAGQSSAMGLGHGLTGMASTAPTFSAPFAASQVAPLTAPSGIELGTGLLPSSAVIPADATTGQNAYRNLMASQLLARSLDSTRTNVSPSPIRGGKEVNLASPVVGLLQAQPMRRRKEMLSLL